MFPNIRQSMAWLHTWFGLALGFVLMVCFFFGSLSVFDREIDRWALPETRFAPQPAPSFDRVLAPVFKQLKPHPVDAAATQERVIGPLPDLATLPMASLYYYRTHRDPVLQIGAEFAVPNKLKDSKDDHAHVHGWATLDPRSGRFLPENQFKIGSEFFYPLHFSLHLQWKSLGYWIVGLASLMMLAALVSGVVMHRKIFREFFTFRPWKSAQRSSLDLHNLTGVAGLPFHFFFAFTGLVIFAGIYLPLSETQLKPLADHQMLVEAARTGLPHEEAHIPAPLASVDAMVLEAKRRWTARDMPGEVGLLTIEHLGDKNSYVSIYRAGNDQVALVGQGVHFEASSGRVIREDPPPNLTMSAAEFLTGLHLQHFRHWGLRWLYVAGGLLGCACIATGFLFFIEKRRQQHARAGKAGSRVVGALGMFVVTGMVGAAIAILVANRLLPAELVDRAGWERTVFWSAWLAFGLHAALRHLPEDPRHARRAWREQCVAIAVLAVGAVLANAVTTGDHLLKTVFWDTYWPVAGLDLSLLAAAVAALWTARRLAAPAAVRQPRAVPENAQVRHG